MMRFCAFPLAITLTAVLAAAQTTEPSAGGGELMQNKSEMIGYGAEKFRLVNRPDEIVAVLRNNMTIIVKRAATPVVAIRGLVGTGGVYEGKWLGGGLSHLLEHLVAGGSNDRRTEAENRNLLQQIGNNSNAYTTEENTAFFVNTTPPHFEQAVDLVTGWLLGAQITAPEYRREFQVVQRELEMGKGEPDRQFAYMSAMNRYRVSPARVPVIGYQEVIQGLNWEDVRSYYELAYEPSNMIFCVVGDLDPEQMLATVRKYVSDAKPKRVFSHDIESEPPVVAPRTLTASFPKLGQARLELGFPSVKLQHPDLYVMDLLATIVGGGDSSLAVEDLRDDKQLVSQIGADDDTPPYVDGTFAVDMQLDPDKVETATAETLKLLQHLKDEPIDQDRIDRAKVQIKVARVKSLETAEEICSSLADDFMMTGDPDFQDKYVERIQRLTAADLQAAAKKYLDTSKLITTVMYPAESPQGQAVASAQEVLKSAIPAQTPTETVHRTVLDNGVVLLTKHVGTSPIVVMNMFSLGGVTAEDRQTNGVGNLAMEMLVRGTTSKSAQQIAEFFDSVGGELNCACGNNSWYWRASCLKEDFEKTLAVYADVVNNPTFADAELAGMKQRVAAAISEEDADWAQQAIRFFKQQFFGPSNSPYQFIPIGTVENVQKFSAEQVRQWYQQKVLASPRVLAIYGDIDPDQATALARQYLGSGVKASAATAGNPSQAPTTAASAGKATVNVLDVKVQQTEQALAGVMVGFISDSVWGQSENFPLDVGQAMAGGWVYPTGYLFETLRGKGLVYVVEAQNNPGAAPRFQAIFSCSPGASRRRSTKSSSRFC